MDGLMITFLLGFEVSYCQHRTWYVVHGTWHMVHEHGTRYTVHGTYSRSMSFHAVAFASWYRWLRVQRRPPPPPSFFSTTTPDDSNGEKNRRYRGTSFPQPGGRGSSPRDRSLRYRFLRRGCTPTLLNRRHGSVQTK